MGKLLFEVKTPDGKTYQLFDDGGMTGFPDGTIIDKFVDDVKRREHPITGFYDSRFPPLFMRRRLVFTLENDLVGDRFFSPEVVSTLRELADLIEQGKAGNDTREVYMGPRGTLAIIAADDITAVCIQSPTAHNQHPADDQKSASSVSP